MCLDCFEVSALKTMAEVAKILNVPFGAAVSLVVPAKQANDWKFLSPRILVHGIEFFREADPSKGVGDTGTNYVGVACSKMAEMLCIHADCGSQLLPAKKGELGIKGGILRPFSYRGVEYLIYLAFSRGTEDEDVQIAEAGWKRFQVELGKQYDPEHCHHEMILVTTAPCAGE
ncbi:MAG: hypothetical protein HGB11_14455 [Chlorobiales bacterium]|nr:hypothetical protein [Chlorobiales bacterium]